MKKTGLTLLATIVLLLITTFDSHGQGFSLTATNWTLPAGGESDDDFNYNFRYTAYSTFSGDDLGSQSWTVMDLNGDGKLDLVVYAENQATGIFVFSPTSNPFWKVYLNTGSGYSTTATNWSLPAGGEKDDDKNYGFRKISYNAYSSDDIGSQSWTVMDMNGDGKPDLVVHAEKQATDVLVFGASSNPFWKVYLNTGSGFSTTATNWSLPAGGEKYDGINFSFRKIAYSAYSGDDLGSQSWTVMDMNGDGKIDLVVHAEKQATDILVFSPTNNPYWKVYLNTGSGFSTTATNWSLPAGGQKDDDKNYGFRHIAYSSNLLTDLGSQSWTVMDMNGDSKLDLVVFAENQTTIVTVFNPANNPYWKVYLNTGSGFSLTATNWSLPAGGEKDDDLNYGFRNISYSSNLLNDLGSQSWNVMDMNGDSKPDLVVLAEKQASNVLVFNSTTNPIWKVYLNTATTLGVPAFEDNKINITIYPNPSNGKFQFAIDDLQFAKNSKAIMYDIKGVVVYQTEITNVLTDVDLSHLTSGMYFVKIYNEDTTITKKIIIE